MAMSFPHSDPFVDPYAESLSFSPASSSGRASVDVLSVLSTGAEEAGSAGAAWSAIVVTKIVGSYQAKISSTINRENMRRT